MSELYNTATHLSELGYKVFPCVPGGKKPLISAANGGRGCRDATTDTEQIEAWWSAEPNANIGLSTEGLLVVDIDGAENEWLKNADIRASLTNSATSQTPRGGLHCIFKQPAGSDYRNTAGTLAPNVDTRANGGYIIVAPSVVDGKQYKWLETFELTEPIESLTVAPDWILEKLTQTKSEPFALPADSVIRKGTQENTLFKIGCKARRWGASFSEINALLQTANAERCEQPGTQQEIERIARNAAKYEPDQLEQSEVEGWVDQYLGDDSKPKEKSSRDPGPFPQHLLHVPGYIERVMQYNLSGAYKKQPELSLAAAITLMGVLTGRKITDDYGTRTNVYCLGVCRSGGGKEHPRKVNKTILYEAGLSHMLGSEGIASHAGLVASVKKQESILFQLDEIGRLIKTLASPQAGAHLYHIATVLMKLFTTSDSVYIGDAYADTDKTKTIVQPHACLFGTTVPQSLYEGLTAESVTDGFLSRMMIFEAVDHTPRPSGCGRVELPEWIKEKTKQWDQYPAHRPLIRETVPYPEVIPYDSHAETLFQDLEDISYQAQQTENEMIACLWTRTVEKARKLALIYACSDSIETTIVTKEAAEWACELSKYLTEKMIHTVETWVSENPFHAMQKEVLRFITNAGSAGVRKSALCRKFQKIRQKERGEVLEALELSGQIEPKLTPTARKPVTTYHATGQ